MTLLEQKTNEICMKLHKDGHTYALDPLTILMILKILIQIAIYIYKCQKSKEERYKLILFPRLFGRLFIRRFINEKTKELLKTENFNPDLENEILKMCKSLTRIEVEQIFSEVEREYKLA